MISQKLQPDQVSEVLKQQQSPFQSVRSSKNNVRIGRNVLNVTNKCELPENRWNHSTASSKVKDFDVCQIEYDKH